MKSYVANGTGSQQTLTDSQDNKIPVYDSVTDAESDLANLAENQIIATHDTGSELSAPVDTVQSGNMHAVTSNAVAESCTKYPDYARGSIYVQPSTGDYITTEDVFISYITIGNGGGAIADSQLVIDGVTVGIYDYSGSTGLTYFSGFVKAGAHINRVSGNAPSAINFKVFGLIE